MRILAIETSCDETAVAVLEGSGDDSDRSFSTTFMVLGNALNSQIEIHKEYGGVFPALAKREHAKNLTPLMVETLEQAFLLLDRTKSDLDQKVELRELLSREPEMFEMLVEFLETHEKPDIDAIAVTEGPGLEPALWVGINFAKALSIAWNIPVIPINHMEGHIIASLVNELTELGTVHFPALALLISGGHTELVLMKDWMEYKLVGSTRDDAVGEAFDKVARTLGLDYPGGPEISRLAKESRIKRDRSSISLPRPMIGTNDCDFSFSGLKTAVLYQVKEIENMTDDMREEFAHEFEDAVVELLLKKTKRAIDEHNVQTLILGGGVSANTEIRRAFTELFEKECPDNLLYIPDPELSTDNAIMIGLAGLLRASRNTDRDIRAVGNLKLTT